MALSDILRAELLSEHPEQCTSASSSAAGSSMGRWSTFTHIWTGQIETSFSNKDTFVLQRQRRCRLQRGFFVCSSSQSSLIINEVFSQTPVVPVSRSGDQCRTKPTTEPRGKVPPYSTCRRRNRSGSREATVRWSAGCENPRASRVLEFGQVAQIRPPKESV